MRGSAWRRRLGTASASTNIETGNSVSIGPGKSEKANREAVSKLIKILGMLGTRHRRAALLSSVEAHRLEGSTQLTCGDRGVEQAKAPAEGSAGHTR